jgi:PKD repeat protein/DNA-binding transcriptional ArsR family regulator
MFDHKKSRSIVEPVTLRSLCILSMFVFISFMPLFFIDAGANTGSRQSFSVAIDQVPTLHEDESNIFNASVQGIAPELISGLTFKWDFGDQYSNQSNPKKITATGMTSATHIYTEAGSYSVGLTVSDDQADQSTTTATVVVKNVAPTPDLSIQRRSTFEDEPITFMASGQLDTPSDIPTLVYSWALDNEQPSAYSNKPSTERTYPQAGTHTVTLAVKDKHGAIATVSKIFSVDDQPPLAVATYVMSEFGEWQINFDASSSLDTSSDLAMLKYSWDFGDGNNLTDAKVSHSFSKSGKYSVWLTVTDDDGLSTKQLLVVNINNMAPTARFVVQQEGGSDFVVLDASNSTDTRDEIDKLSYNWVVGDSTVAQGKTVTYRFDSLGLHKVKLTVTDPEGAVSQVDQSVSVTNHAPYVSLEPVKLVEEDRTVSFVSKAISDAESSPITLYWEFDDLKIDSTGIHFDGTPVSFNRTYSAGAHWVRLHASDERGAWSYDQLDFEVIDPRPSVNFKVDDLGLSGNSVHFDASLTKDNPSDIASLVYSWSFGDGTVQTGISVDHIFNKAGDYKVNLTVTDHSGASSIMQRIIMIIAQDLWDRYNGKILTVYFTVNDTHDGEPGISLNEEIAISGKIGLVSDWTGPDLLHRYTTLVTAQIVGSNRTWQTRAGPDGDFTIFLPAPSRSGPFTLKVLATMSPLSAEATSQHKVEKQETAASPVSMPLVVGAVSATAGLIAIGAIGGTDLGRYKFFTLLIPLFTRLKKPKILDHFERGRIYEHIRKTPGDTYSSIRKALDIQNGALAHHLRVLEFHEYIVSRRDGMYKRFYPKGMRIPEGKHKSIQEQMLEMIMANPKITQKQMAERLGIDRSTVNYHVKILLAMGVIRSEKDGQIKYYYFVGIKEPLPFEG